MFYLNSEQVTFFLNINFHLGYCSELDELEMPATMADRCVR